MLLRVGTRGSKLSLVQTDIVLDQLKRKDPKLVVERKIIKTKGDEDQRTPIFSINQKGIFEKEIDQAILEGKLDVAVDTRVQKVEDGEFDAVILAEAGLLRLGLTGRIAERLSLEDFMPAPGQGILALIARQDNMKVLELLRSIEDPPTMAQADAERELVNVLEGGCKVPIGALASSNRDSLYVTGCILSSDGKTRLESKKSGNIKEAAWLGREVAEELIAKGAKKIEETWRGSYYRD